MIGRIRQVASWRGALKLLSLCGLAGCLNTATVRDGRLRDETMLTVSAPMYSGPLARGQRRGRDCPSCEPFELTLPLAAAQPVVTFRGGGQITDWFAFGSVVGVNTPGLNIGVLLRFRLFAGERLALAMTGEVGFGADMVSLKWSNRVSLDASVDAFDWLAIYASPHLGQFGSVAEEIEGIGTDVWGVNGGLRWKLGAVVALYTELGWTRSMETPHSVLTPTLGVAFARRDSDSERLRR